MDSSGLFSGIDRPYNTVTSPDEQDADATGNDQGTASQAPMSKILAAVMRGAARLQGQEQAKSVSASQQASNAKMTLTMKPGAPGEPPLVTVKDAPADLLNGTQQGDLAQAYTNPSKQVEAKLAAPGSPVSESADNAPDSSSAAPGITPPATAPAAGVDVVDHTLGYHLPRGADPDIAEKLKTPNGIRELNYELGGNEEHARITIDALKKGRITPQEVHDRVAVYRERKYAQIHQEIQGPLDKAQAEQDRQDRLTFAKAEEQRRLKTQSDAETKAANEEKLGFLKSNDLSLLDSDPAKMLAAVHAGTNATWTPQDDQRALIKRQQDVNAAFKDFTDTKKNTFSLGNYDSWEDAKGAFGFPLSPEQDKMGAGRWKADHAYVLREAALLRSTQEGRAAKLEHLQYLNEHQGDVKPVSLDDGFVKGVSAPELISVLPTAKNPDLVLQRKEAFLTNEIQDRSDKLRKAQQDAKALNLMPTTARRFQWPVDVANAHADAQTHANRITAAQAELQQIQAARAARKQGGSPTATTPPAAPKPGDKKTFTAGPYAGKTGVWNGTGYVVQ